MRKRRTCARDLAVSYDDVAWVALFEANNVTVLVLAVAVDNTNMGVLIAVWVAAGVVVGVVVVVGDVVAVAIGWA